MWVRFNCILITVKSKQRLFNKNTELWLSNSNGIIRFEACPAYYVEVEMYLALK